MGDHTLRNLIFRFSIISNFGYKYTTVYIRPLITSNGIAGFNAVPLQPFLVFISLSS